MFTKPLYTTADLNDALGRIERLTRLQEQALQNYRLLRDERYKDTYDRLSANLMTSQLYYQKIMEKLTR